MGSVPHPAVAGQASVNSSRGAAQPGWRAIIGQTDSGDDGGSQEQWTAPLSRYYRRHHLRGLCLIVAR